MTHASAREMRVVHSSRGRLRVHVPDRDGQVVSRLRALRGVTSAQASELTGNVLILFDPRQTSEQRLLEELGFPPVSAPERVQQPLPQPLPETERGAKHRFSSPLRFGEWWKGGETSGRSSSSGEEPLHVVRLDHADPAGSPAYVMGPLRNLYQALGWSSVGMAIVGAITPGIPTTPFALLAGYFFIRSSPAAHDWLLRSRWLGPIVQDWERHRGVRPGVKAAAVGLIAGSMVLTWLLGLPAAVTATILTFEVIGLVIVVRLPVVEAAPASTPVTL
jgi:uncharacterized membrane protein YbaN (DUF454 family)